MLRLLNFSAKDDFRIKADLQEKELLDLHQKVGYFISYSSFYGVFFKKKKLLHIIIIMVDNSRQFLSHFDGSADHNN